MFRSLLVACVVLLARPVFAQGVAVDFTTTPNGGQFAPRNVVAVWIENSGGGFIKTIGRWSNQRTSHLVNWIAASGQDSDAVTGATRNDHNLALHVSWDLKDRNGNVVPDGTYTVRMELADSNSSTASQNHEGTFTFVKGATGSKQVGLSNGGFVNASITFTSAAMCGNGVVDVGETCDGVDCPTACAVNDSACHPVALQGTAASCTAICVQTDITACSGAQVSDGCCPAGCTAANDMDCANEAATVEGDAACSASSGTPALGLLIAGSMLLAVRRRRR